MRIDVHDLILRPLAGGFRRAGRSPSGSRGDIPLEDRHSTPPPQAPRAAVPSIPCLSLLHYSGSSDSKGHPLAEVSDRSLAAEGSPQIRPILQSRGDEIDEGGTHVNTKLNLSINDPKIYRNGHFYGNLKYHRVRTKVKRRLRSRLDLGGKRRNAV